MWPPGSYGFLSLDTYYYYRYLSNSRRNSKGMAIMSERQSQSSELEVKPTSSMGLLFCRMVWFFGGPVISLLFAMMLATRRTGWISGYDLAFLAAVIMTIAARWTSYRFGDLTDTTGGITSAQGLQRYTLSAITIGILVWVAANFVGNYLVG